MSWLYSAFGLTIISNEAVPGLFPITAIQASDHDVIRLELFGNSSSSLPDGYRKSIYTSKILGLFGHPILEVWILSDTNYYRFRYDDGTEFVVDTTGTQIWASWPSPLTIEDTAPFITGPILGFVLRLRMVVCLHASVILFAPGRAVAFVGRARAGKSTLAAAFSLLGYPVLSDDIAALREDEIDFSVLPAHPTIRLWDSSVRELFGSETSLPRIAPDDPNWTKRYLQLGSDEHAFWNKPEQLAGIYILDGRDDELTYPQFYSSPPKDNLVTLIQNTYMNYLLGKEARALEFDFLSRLIDEVKVRRVLIPGNLSSIRLVCNSIVDDFHSLGS